jgi:hypothetical protein
LREDEKDRLANAISSMRELEDRPKEQFGQAAAPQLQLLSPDGKPLAGGRLVAQVDRGSDEAARFGLLISYFGGYETHHECRVAMAQEQYRSGHHGEYCYQMWLSGRWDIDTPDDRDIGP